MEQVVFFLAGAASAGGGTANKDGSTAGDDALSPVAVQPGEMLENVVKMKKPHCPALVLFRRVRRPGPPERDGRHA